MTDPRIEALPERLTAAMDENKMTPDVYKTINDARWHIQRLRIEIKSLKLQLSAH